MGAVNGALIVATRVPDIVVTLAMLFVWQGVALIPNAPGGAAAPRPAQPHRRWGDDLGLAVGADGMAAEGAGVPDGLSCGDLVADLSVEAGADVLCHRVRRPAWRSGRACRWAAPGLPPMLHAAVCRAGGLSVTMSTGIGELIPSCTSTSVAAVVLGVVVLGGGAGGLLGPILAVFILRLVRLDSTLLSVDPNVAAIIEGTIMVVVVMFGAVLALRGRQP